MNGLYAGVSFAASVAGHDGVQGISVQNTGAVTALTNGQSVQAIVGTVGLPAGVSSIPAIPPVRIDPPVTLDEADILQMLVNYQDLLLKLDDMWTTKIEPKMDELDDLRERNEDIVVLLRDAVGPARDALIAELSANSTRIGKLREELTILQIEYNRLAANAHSMYHYFLTYFLTPEQLENVRPPLELLDLPWPYVNPQTGVV